MVCEIGIKKNFSFAIQGALVLLSTILQLNYLFVLIHYLFLMRFNNAGHIMHTTVCKMALTVFLLNILCSLFECGKCWFNKLRNLLAVFVVRVLVEGRLNFIV